MFSRYQRLHFDEVVLRRIARSTRVLFDVQQTSNRYRSIGLPSEDIDAPDNRKSLSPIWIGNTLRAGRTIGIAGSVNVRLGLLVPACGPAASVSAAEGLLLLSVVSVALRKRGPGPGPGPAWERVLCAGGLSTGEVSSSPDSLIMREERLGSGCLPDELLSRSADFRLLPATEPGAPGGRLGTAKP